ncbi:50S ribosomal protein L21 [bacterium]|nr:50S ribosomal protein L21 [bacterium]
MYAIINAGGKQYKVEEGRYIDMELQGEVDSKVTFDEVVMLVNGKKSKVGSPFVKNASVEGTVQLNGRTKKVLVYKQRPKKGYRVKQGHRQDFSRVMITKIRTAAAKAAKASEATDAAPAENKEN